MEGIRRIPVDRSEAKAAGMGFDWQYTRSKSEAELASSVVQYYVTFEVVIHKKNPFCCKLKSVTQYKALLFDNPPAPGR